MIIKYIDNNYIINEFGKTSWADVEEPDLFIGRASSRIRTLIFPSDKGNPDDITTYTPEQQEAIKETTAMYALYYCSIDYDFSSGSISGNFGGASFSESRNYNGELVIPNVYDILKTAGLIPVNEIFSIDLGIKDLNTFKKESDIEKRVEKIEESNIQRDNKILDLETKKQGKLIAGKNITITENNIISSTGGSGTAEYTTDTPEFLEINNLLKKINTKNIMNKTYIDNADTLLENQINIIYNNYANLNQQNIYQETQIYNKDLNAQFIATVRGTVNQDVDKSSLSKYIVNQRSLFKAILPAETDISNLKNLQVIDKTNIDLNKKDIENLSRKQQSALKYKGLYDNRNTYDLNDIVYKVDGETITTYLSLISGNTQPLSNKSAWYENPTLEMGVDLSNYYTIEATNNLLRPLEIDLNLIDTQILESNKLIADNSRRVAVLSTQLEGVAASSNKNKILINQNIIDIANNLKELNAEKIKITNLIADQARQDAEILINTTNINLNKEQLASTLKIKSFWRNDVEYKINDVVWAVRAGEKVYFVCIKDNINQIPTVKEYWTESPEFSVSADFENYYTKEETNNLLIPLGPRLDAIEIKIIAGEKLLLEHANKLVDLDVSTKKNATDIIDLETSIAAIQEQNLNVLIPKITDNINDINILKTTKKDNLTFESNIALWTGDVIDGKKVKEVYFPQRDITPNIDVATGIADVEAILDGSISRTTTFDTTYTFSFAGSSKGSAELNLKDGNQLKWFVATATDYENRIGGFCKYLSTETATRSEIRLFKVNNLINLIKNKIFRKNRKAGK